MLVIPVPLDYYTKRDHSLIGRLTIGYRYAPCHGLTICAAWKAVAGAWGASTANRLSN
jgi:hypothetical protein